MWPAWHRSLCEGVCKLVDESKQQQHRPYLDKGIRRPDASGVCALPTAAPALLGPPTALLPAPAAGLTRDAAPTGSGARCTCRRAATAASGRRKDVARGQRRNAGAAAPAIIEPAGRAICRDSRRAACNRDW